MSWFTSILIALLTAAAGALAGGYVASLAVDWYRVSSREGASGYFIIAMGLIGLIVGFGLGLVVSRKVAGAADPGFLKALAFSLVPLLGVVAVIGGVSRLLADVPPKLAGEELLLAVELRWPEGHAKSPAAEPGEWRLRLSSSSNHTVRAHKDGPLWKEDAHLVDGRWVVPGAVEVFTQRGDRILDALPDGVISNGFIIPLPSYPGAKDLQWSDWFPHARPGEPPLPNGYTYRFRVVPRSQPIRTETWGPFEIDTIARSFGEVTYDGQPTTYAAGAQFALRFRGQPVVIDRANAPIDPDVREPANARYERADAVAILAGPKPALLVQVGAPYEAGPCYLLVDEGDRLRIDYVAAAQHALNAPPVTGDAAWFNERRDKRMPPGRVERANFARAGLYLFPGAVLDTRNLAVRRFAAAGSQDALDAIPPLALSPDERSFAVLAFADAARDTHALKVTDIHTRQTYALPLDKAAMRYARPEQLDPAWVDHYFAWERGPAGTDRLVARAGAAPLPYRGALSAESSGYREYRLAPAQPSLRTALADFLVKEFNGEQVPAAAEAYAHEVRIDGRVISIGYGKDEQQIVLFTDRNGDARIVATIAQRFDAALATGAYDRHFVQ